MVDQYGKALEKAEVELKQLLALHSQTEKRIANLKLTINGLRQLRDIGGVLSETDGVVEMASPATVLRELGFTDSIREVLKAKSPLYVPEIKEELINLGFDETRYSNFIGAIHVVLKRLERNGEVKPDESGDHTRYSFIPTQQQNLERFAQHIAKKKKS